jgi:polyhydroxybutyrate depolymerase
LYTGIACAAGDNEANDTEESNPVGAVERSYLVHRPPGIESDHALPLVVDLHGGGGQASTARQQTRFNDLADRYGFIVAYPNGSGKQRALMAAVNRRFLTFNAGACCAYAAEHHVDDVAFIRAMVARLEAEYPIDRYRIYATGMSNGGMMSYRLACEASEIFAAVGVVSGAQLVSRCAPQRPVSLIHIHGSADRYVPFNGGEGDKSLVDFDAPPTRSSVSFWARRDGCSVTPRHTVQGSIEHDEYPGCAAGLGVELYVVDGGGHAWPGGERMSRRGDEATQEMSASQVIWQFFAAHPKRDS